MSQKAKQTLLFVFSTVAGSVIRPAEEPAGLREA